MLDPVVKPIRALLTETLPYEVPVNFSNEFLFVSELRKSELTEKLKDFLNQHYRRQLREDKYTIAFSYPIRKGSSGTNTISIIHPLQQLNVANFIQNYSNTILQECNESENSLRAPFEVLPAVSKDDLKKFGNVKKLGIPHIAPREGELDLNFAPSYFSLKRYNLLDKFYNSNELVRLESRFRLLKTLDVSRCFFNIYTHSITWAVKGKKYSKDEAGKYSFEGRFDNLMQKSNYNETNGIVVGPEISRVFAEIILQKIDQNICMELEARGKVGEADFALRRYVDDYFLFAKNEAILDEMVGAIERCLEEYKLFLNSEKTRSVARPFVTNVTRAKRGVDGICEKIILEASKPLSADPKDQQETSKNFRSLLEDLRIIVGEAGTSFNETTGSIYFKISRAARELGDVCEGLDETKEPDVVKRLRGLLRLLFYSVSCDFRVAPIYKCYQIVEDLSAVKKHLSQSSQTALDDRIIFEICELLKAYPPDEKDLSEGNVSLEICNLVLLGNYVGTDTFLQQAPIRRLVRLLVKCDKLGYFAFVAVMYTLGNSAQNQSDKIEAVAKAVGKHIKSRKNEVRQDSHLYLLLSDFLSCPFIKEDRKRDLLDSVYQQSDFSDKDLAELAPHVAFVDWKGGRTSHFLRRKRLQPVYHSI